MAKTQRKPSEQGMHSRSPSMPMKTYTISRAGELWSCSAKELEEAILNDEMEAYTIHHVWCVDQKNLEDWLVNGKTEYTYGDYFTISSFYNRNESKGFGCRSHSKEAESKNTKPTLD